MGNMNFHVHISGALFLQNPLSQTKTGFLPSTNIPIVKIHPFIFLLGGIAFCCCSLSQLVSWLHPG